MTIYLPNPDMRPTGDEVAEFIDIPPMSETVGRAPVVTRSDLAANVSAESVEALCAISPLRNGPLSVVGPVALAQVDGTLTLEHRLLLCRCGHSGTKPKCDGSHNRVGFIAPGVVDAPS